MLKVLVILFISIIFGLRFRPQDDFPKPYRWMLVLALATICAIFVAVGIHPLFPALILAVIFIIQLTVNNEQCNRSFNNLAVPFAVTLSFAIARNLDLRGNYAPSFKTFGFIIWPLVAYLAIVFAGKVKLVKESEGSTSSGFLTGLDNFINSPNFKYVVWTVIAVIIWCIILF